MALGTHHSLTHFTLRRNSRTSVNCYLIVTFSFKAMVLCHFLDTHREEYNLMDKNIIELGAGTGLVTIVTSLLGERDGYRVKYNVEYFKYLGIKIEVVSKKKKKKSQQYYSIVFLN